MATYETTVRTASIPAAGTYNITFNTGAIPAVFLNRIIGFTGTAGSAVVYEAPTGVSGGTVQASYQADQLETQAARGVMTIGVTVGGVGTQRSAISYYKGAAGPSVGTYSASTGQRRLKPFTTYLLQFTNSDVGAQVIDIYFRWYEGPDATPQG